MKKVVYTVQTEITEDDIQDVVGLLNMCIPEDAPILTVEEVINNPELLGFISEQLVQKDSEIDNNLIDAFEGFLDFRTK